MLPQVQKPHIHFGHLGAVFLAAIFLLGISWMKNPNLLNALRPQAEKSAALEDLPRYYAYTLPSELDQALVAGASTENPGPMVINEDGSLSPAIAAGEVLGADTSGAVLDLDSIKIKTIPDSDENLKAYLKDLQAIEGGYLDSIQFEAALSSGDQGQIDGQAAAVAAIIDGLSAAPAPVSFSHLHRLKILQYRSALAILKNFTAADSNPELINRNLDVFLRTEQQIQAAVAAAGKSLSAIFEP